MGKPLGIPFTAVAVRSACEVAVAPPRSRLTHGEQSSHPHHTGRRSTTQVPTHPAQAPRASCSKVFTVFGLIPQDQTISLAAFQLVVSRMVFLMLCIAVRSLGTATTREGYCLFMLRHATPALVQMRPELVFVFNQNQRLDSARICICPKCFASETVAAPMPIISI